MQLDRTGIHKHAAEQGSDPEPPDEALAEAAAELAVEGTAAMANNSYKIQEVRALIKKMILDMGAVQA